MQDVISDPASYSTIIHSEYILTHVNLFIDTLFIMYVLVIVLSSSKFHIIATTHA